VKRRRRGQNCHGGAVDAFWGPGQPGSGRPGDQPIDRRLAAPRTANTSADTVTADTAADTVMVDTVMADTATDTVTADTAADAADGRREVPTNETEE